MNTTPARETPTGPVVNAQYLGEAHRQALVTLLWSETDESTPEGGEPMDANYDSEDIAPELSEKIRTELAQFIADNAADLIDDNGVVMDAGQCGHDFILTRNGHGAGFWDRGLGERGDRLTTACKVYGEISAYVGDDGKIYGM